MDLAYVPCVYVSLNNYSLISPSVLLCRHPPTIERSAQREAALKEVKERAKALKAKQAKTKSAGGAAGGSKQASKTKTAVKARGTQR